VFDIGALIGGRADGDQSRADRPDQAVFIHRGALRLIGLPVDFITRYYLPIDILDEGRHLQGGAHVKPAGIDSVYDESVRHRAQRSGVEPPNYISIE